MIPLETAVIWSEIDDKTGQIVLFRYKRERERDTIHTTLVCAREAKLHFFDRINTCKNKSFLLYIHAIVL